MNELTDIFEKHNKHWKAELAFEIAAGGFIAIGATATTTVSGFLATLAVAEKLPPHSLAQILAIYAGSALTVGSSLIYPLLEPRITRCVRRIAKAAVRGNGKLHPSI